MQKDKENSLELPTAANKTRHSGDVTTTIDLDNDGEGKANDKGEATSPPEWLHNPKLDFPTEEEIADTYHTEEYEPEPSKFHKVNRGAETTPIGNQQVRVAEEHLAQPRTTHVSYRRDKKRRQRPKIKKRGSLELVIILLSVILLVVVYQHRVTLEVLAEPWLQKLYQHVKIQMGEGESDSSITEISNDGEGDNPAPLALSEMRCYDLMPRALKVNIAELEFEAQVAIAECYYLRGDYLQSYRLLQKNEQQLQDESLLLYTMLLLKRRQFSAVRALLQGKCVRPAKHQQFFPCLAQGLLSLQQSGRVSLTVEPSVAPENSSYSAIAWLLQALYYRTYDVSSDYITQATSVGERSNRRVALSYVYETLIRFTYQHGSAEQLNRIRALAVHKLHDEHAAAHWWVRFVARLGTAEVKKKEVLYVLSSKDNFARMYDNLDFLNIIGTESIYFGYSALWETVIKRMQHYQKRTWKTEARATIQFLQQWRTRILVARDHRREVIKSLKSYVNNYGKDYFYCFFLGIALMNTPRNNATYRSSTALLARSLSLRDSWDNNYAYALALLKSGRSAPLTGHMHKLEQLAITPVHKKWLFLLRAEIKISRGRHDAAIRDLRGYIAKHPHSFVAHRLLLATYMRANRPREAVVVRKAYDRLQNRVPYYSTEEGLNSPIGALALL